MSDTPAWLEGAVSVGSGGEPAKPAEEKPNPWGYGARRGVAAMVGNIADAPERVYNIGAAQAGLALARPLSMLTGKPESTFLPETTNYNRGTEALMRMLGVQGDPGYDTTDKFKAAIGEGAGASLAGPTGGVRQVLKETLKQIGIGGFAGAGGEAGAQLSGNSPIGRLIGSLLSVAGASQGGAMATTYRAVRDVKEAAKNPANADLANSLAGRVVDSQLRSAASGAPDAPANITEALALRQKFGPDFQPSVAEMAGAPGLVDMQRRYALLSPGNLNREVAKDAANRGAVRSYYEQNAPQAGAPSAPRSALNESLAAQEKGLAESGQQVAGQLPKADPLAAGNKLSDLAWAERRAAKGEISSAYQKAFDAAEGGKVDIAPVIAKVEEILGQKLSEVKPESAPNTVARIKQIFGKEPEASPVLGPDGKPILNAADTTVTLEDADAIRKAINADIVAGHRSLDPMAATRLRNLGQVHGTLDEAVKASPLGQSAKDLYSDALNQYREGYVPRFKEGANARMFKESSTGEPRILPDKTVSEYFKPDEAGGLTRASQFKALFGNNAEAKATTEKGILDLYRNDVVDKTTGIINTAKHDEFMRQHSRTLDAFKGAGVNAADQIATIGKQAREAATAIGKFSDLAKGLRFDSTDALVTAALREPKTMGNVLGRMAPEARETFKRILMDKAWEGGNAASMVKYLDDNQNTLRMALSPKHLDDLSSIAKGLEIVERSPIRGTLQAGGPDVLKNATGVSTATVWSQWRATTGGRQSPATMAFNLAAPVMNKLSQQQFSALMEKALHDPNTASALRQFLVAPSPSQANYWANLLSGAKLAGNIAWSAKGPIARVAFGTENYGPNLRRAVPAVSVMTQEQQ